MPPSPAQAQGQEREYGSLSKSDVDGNASATGAFQRPLSSVTKSIQKKVPLATFLWHQHSVLGMTVPDGDVVPPIVAGPCCEVDPTGLTRRRRMFLFFLVLFVSTTLAVQVSLGHHGSFYALNAMVLIVLPLVCHLKENLPTYSKWFMSRGIGERL